MQRPNCEHGRPSACCCHWCAIVVVVVVVMVVIEASKQASKQASKHFRRAGPMCRMATVRTCSFVDAVRSSGPVRFASPVQFARFAGSRGSPVRTVRPKSEIVMKMVAVRAVEKPSSAFCTEFRCESFRDDVVFQFFPQQCLHLRGSYLLCKEVHLS